MSTTIETLEGRTLFSLTIPAGFLPAADQTRILADVKTIRADIRHSAPLLSRDVKLIRSDLRKLPKSPQNHTLLAAFNRDERHQLSVVQHDLGAIAHAGSSQLRAAIVDGIRLLLDPFNSAKQSRLASDIQKLADTTSGPVATLLSDLASTQTVLSNDLSAIANANPTDSALQSDAATALSDTSTTLGTTLADVQTVQTDLGIVVKDLG